MTLKIGWCLIAPYARAAYEPPSKVLITAPKAQKGVGFSNCPAVHAFFENTYQVLAPFSLRIRCISKGDKLLFHPVYPHTSLSEKKFHELVLFEPSDTWQGKKNVVFQIPSPYVFFSDENAFVEQFSPSILRNSFLNWRLIPGKFNIYDWQRPLNFAVEWDTSLGDFILKVGEPLYFVRFTSDRVTQGITLIESEMTNNLKERLSLSEGITGIRKGLNPIMKKTGLTRKNETLIKEIRNENIS